MLTYNIFRMKIKISVILLSVLLFSCKTENENTPEKKDVSNKIKVAVFSGNGASPVCVTETLEALKIDKGIAGKAIDGHDVAAGELSKFDVIIFPGGSGSKELNNLGKSGVDSIRNFVIKKGKGLIGICAGAFMTMSTDGYPSLKLSGYKQLDRPHYNRGRGLVEFSLNERGLQHFPELKNHKLFLQYYDGPVMQLKDSTKKDTSELGKFVSDIHPDNFAPAGLTLGKTFLYFQNSGNGKIAGIAGHPEATPGMRWMVPRMARLVSNKKIVKYDTFWVRPQLNDKEIFFDRALRKREKELFYDLLSDSAELQIAAMDTLYSYRSRPAVRWNIGLLRDKNPKIRKHAAYLLMQAEYSAALPDLQTALKSEADQNVKKQISRTISVLSGI